MIATNTIPLSKELEAIGKIKILSVAPIFGEAIIRIHSESSVSSLFDSDGDL